MTKTELSKCEKVCIEAITDIKESERLYKAAESKDKDLKQATIELRRADNKRGNAEGIHQALSMLGYKSENMEQLWKLISN